MHRQNNDERNQAIGMLNAGMSATVVLRHFGCTRKTIDHLRRRFRVTGNVVDRPRSGRPLRYACYVGACSTYVTSVWLQQQPEDSMVFIHRLSENRLRQNVQPIHAYRPYFGQILTPRYRTARRDWCRRHLHFRRAYWELILFSDECRFNHSHADRRERLYRRRGERFADACVIKRDRFRGGSVLV